MESSVPTHAKDNPNVSAEGAPSKNALKKAQKEAEKAAKKAAAKKADEEKRAAQQAQAAEDTAKDKYGELPKDEAPVEITHLKKLGEEHVDKEVTVITRIHNSRSQSAKLAFLMLRQQGKTIQAVVAATSEAVSRQMVKWSVSLNVNSFVRVTGVVKKPDPPVASASISNLELHVQKIYLVARAAEMLPMQVKDAERPPPATAEEGQVDAEGAPIVTLKTRLDNRVIDLQTECNQAIFTISSAVEGLFAEYMRKNGSRQFNTPKLLGAATEGGSGVFTVNNYFGKNGFLAQSPQLHKQMLIAGDCESALSWSVQHSLSNLECAIFLSKWLEQLALTSTVQPLDKDELRLVQMIQGLLSETGLFGDDWIGAIGSTNLLNQKHQIRRLATAVARMWAEIFKGNHVFEVVNIIGASLTIYAESMESAYTPSNVA
ncbi:Aspartate-tRNA ligase, cytoplasmic [Exophiala dermatitidis]